MEQKNTGAEKGKRSHQYPTETESHEAAWQEKVKTVAQKPVEEIIKLKDRHREKLFEFLEDAKVAGQRAHSALKQFNASITALDINLSDYTREESRRVTKKLKEVTDSGYSVTEESHKVKVSGNLEVLELKEGTSTEEVKQRLKEAERIGVEQPLRKAEEPEDPKKPPLQGKGLGGYRGTRSASAALPEVEASKEPKGKEPAKKPGPVDDDDLPLKPPKKVETQQEEYKKKLLNPEETKPTDPTALQALVNKLQEKERRRKEKKKNTRRKRSKREDSSSDGTDSDSSGSSKARRILGENSD